MNTLLHMTASASALIVVITILRALFMHSLPRQTFTALWLIAAVRLLLPVSLPVPIPVPAASPPAAITDTAVYAAPETDTAKTADAAPVVEAVAEDTAVSEAPALSRTLLLSLLWGLGTALTAAAVLVRHRRALKRYREAVPPENPAIGRILAETSCHRRVRVGVCQQIVAPLTYGVFRPVILLPKALEHAPEAQLRYILTHELCHIRRLHIPYKYLLTAALCLHWFSPFAWVMYALANRDLELSCDEAVLRRLDSERRDYALTLITLAQRQRFAPLASGFAASAVKERITNIMKYKKLKTASVIAAVALVMCACTVFASAYTVASDGSFTTGLTAGESASDTSRSGEPIQYTCKAAYYTAQEFETAMAEERRAIEAEVASGVLDRAAADNMLATIRQEIEDIKNGRLVEKPVPVYYADGTPVMNSKGEQLCSTASEIAQCNEQLRWSFYNPPSAATVEDEDIITEEPAMEAVTGTMGAAPATEATDADIHWYTYEEYKQYVEQQKVLCREMEGDFFFNTTDGWQEWTAADTAEMCAQLDENLASLKDGAAIGHTPDGGIIAQSAPGTVSAEADYSTAIGDVVIPMVMQEATAATYEGGTWDSTLLKDYFSYGVSANEKKQFFEFDGKPVAGLCDKGFTTMVDGEARDADGVYLTASRDWLGRLTGVYEITPREFSSLTGLTL